MFGRKKQCNDCLGARGLMRMAEAIVHDIRSPLYEASSCLDDLKRADLAPKDKLVVDRIALAITRARSIVSNAELIRAISSGSLGIEVQRFSQSADIIAVIKDAVDRLARQYADRGIRVTCEFAVNPIIVRFVPSLITAALGEILKNAFDYSSVGSEVAVRASILRDSCQISCQNKGLAVAHSDLEHVFESGWRSQYAFVTNPSGSGNGLWLAREVLQVHGGDVRMMTYEGTTIVTASLPLVER